MTQVSIPSKLIYILMTWLIFSVSCLLQGTEKQNVTHYYFQSWPDHGVPRYATALLGFIRNVRKWHFPSDPSPLAVHCSAGVGRTGTFIVLDIMLQVLEAQAGINVYECILKLRAQRCSMVQTEVSDIHSHFVDFNIIHLYYWCMYMSYVKAQYIFIHDALEELITCGKNEISVADLRIAMNRLSTAHPDTCISGFQQQFQVCILLYIMSCINVCDIKLYIEWRLYISYNFITCINNYTAAGASN